MATKSKTIDLFSFIRNISSIGKLLLTTFTVLQVYSLIKVFMGIMLNFHQYKNYKSIKNHVE